MPTSTSPFCTTEPHDATVPIPDARVEKLQEVFKPKAVILPTLKLWDLPGLVPNAHEGKGLGSAFLSSIAGADALYHVCRAFPGDDPAVAHTEGEVDPVRDLEIVRKELIMKDLATLHKPIDEIESKWRQNPRLKDGKEEYDAFVKAKETLNSNVLLVSRQDWTAKELQVLKPLQLLTAKPGVYLVNLSEKDFARQKNKFLPKIAQWVAERGGGPIVPYSADFEARLANLGSEEARQKYMQDVGAKKSMMERIFRTGYEVLGLHHFFTCGPEEVRAWTIPQGAKAAEAAGTIHPDMEKGFICMELYKFADLQEHGDEAAVKAAGRFAQKSKDYVVEDGDIAFIKFTLAAKAKA